MAVITRRVVLVRGSALAGGLVAATLGLPSTSLQTGHLDSPFTLPTVGAASQIAKCISLGGTRPLFDQISPSDYRYYGNREYIRASGTTWIKLWVSQFAMQQLYPGSNPHASWRHLSTVTGRQIGGNYDFPVINQLDGQIKAANDDGINVLLTLYHEYPTWVTGTVWPEPVTRKPPQQRVPLDNSPEGPRGWFIGFLAQRYKPDGTGNPLGARIQCLEIINEPNLSLWPQQHIASVTIEQIKSAAAISRFWNGPPIYGPATSDYPGPDEPHDTTKMTDWQTFTVRVVRGLQGWNPPVEVRWSHHNYVDIERPEPPPGGGRLGGVQWQLEHNGWRGGRTVWLTEGGYNMGGDYSKLDPQGKLARQRAQERLVREAFLRLRETEGVPIFTQHGINDGPGNPFKSGLRDDWSPPNILGKERLLYYSWATLPPAGPNPPTPPTPVPPSPPPPRVRSSSSATANDAWTLSLPRPSGAAAGDLLLAAMVIEGGIYAPIKLPPGWTEVPASDHQFRENGPRTRAFWKLAGGAEPSAYAFNIPRRPELHPQDMAGGILAVSGAHATAPIDAAAGKAALSQTTTVVAPSITTRVPNTLLVFFGGLGGTVNWTPPAGLIAHYERNSSGRYPVSTMVASQGWQSAGPAGERVAKISVAHRNMGILIAIRPR